MARFIVNKGYTGSGVSGQRTVVASDFQTVGDFIDFYDGEGTVLRIQASSVYTIEREDDQ